MDDIDLANEHEDFFRENALRTARKNPDIPGETPLYLDGVRCCLDCEDPILEARLEANPKAVRCVECQCRHERSGA